MFSSSDSHQVSTINFRLKSAASTSLSVQFLGRDIKVSDLKEKIGERLHSRDSGQSLQLWEASANKLFTDANERIPAFTEILVVRTSETQPGSAYGVGGGGGGGPKEKTAGALGTMEAAKKAAAEVAAMARKAEIDFSSSASTNTGNFQFSSSNQHHQNASGNDNKSEEEKLQELQDIVARDMGVGSSNYGGRGAQGGRGGGAGGQIGSKSTGHNLPSTGNPLAAANLQQQQGGFGGAGGQPDYSGGRGIGAGGSALQRAPSDNYICDLCGKQGHFIEHCPLAQTNGRGGGQHHTRRFAQPVGIPESELEKCAPEEAMFRTRDGQYVRRKLMGLNSGSSIVDAFGVPSLSTTNNNKNGSSESVAQPIIKCMHCGLTWNGDIKNFNLLPCNCDDGKIACKKCVDDGECLEMSEEGPVCAKCGKEIDADEIHAAKLKDFPKKLAGQRRDRK